VWCTAINVVLERKEFACGFVRAHRRIKICLIVQALSERASVRARGQASMGYGVAVEITSGRIGNMPTVNLVSQGQFVATKCFWSRRRRTRWQSAVCWSCSACNFLLLLLCLLLLLFLSLVQTPATLETVLFSVVWLCCSNLKYCVMIIIFGAAASYGEISSPVWIWFVPIGRLLL
jgi:hypothetical protein